MKHLFLFLLFLCSLSIYVRNVGKVKSQSLQFSTNKATETSTNTPDVRTYTVNGESFQMVEVEGGTFLMGATSEQEKPKRDEKPVHVVSLRRYYIGQTEVTQALWQTVMGNNPSDFTGSRKPVENVSWDDCQKFISKLNSLTGKHFRLPTEAEWEYASRGGNKSQCYVYSGSNNLDDVAWYADNSNDVTHDVGTKQGNELGIFDMSGNVLEWCSDWYGDYSDKAKRNPRGAKKGLYRVVRGGSWLNKVDHCRSSYRNCMSSDERNANLGFRIVLSK